MMGRALLWLTVSLAGGCTYQLQTLQSWGDGSDASGDVASGNHQPASGDPASGDPAGDPASGDPAGDPGAGDPASGDPAGDPGVGDPASGDPAGDPGAGDALPCAGPNEPGNDSPSGAEVVGLSEPRSGALCFDDVDWFRVAPAGATRLSLELVSQPDLGTDLVVQAERADSGAVVSLLCATEALASERRMMCNFSDGALSAVGYLVSVSGMAPMAAVTYDITFSAGLACGDDANEINNDLGAVSAQLYNGATQTIQGAVCAADVDWFVFEMDGPKGEAVLFTVSWVDGAKPPVVALGLGCGTEQVCDVGVDLGARDGVLCCAEAVMPGEPYCVVVRGNPTTGVLDTDYELELSVDAFCPF